MRALATVPAWVAALLLLAAPARAQTEPRLAEAVRLAQEGQSDSARIQVQRLLDATSPGDSLYPQILYTQAMVADNAGDMRRQLQRVAVEYNGSSWADDALLRLVQMDYATRNFEGAARNLERLRLDYASTPLLPQAAYWAARTYFDMKNPSLACRWLADGMAQSRDDIELQNQLSYMYQRCDLRGDSSTQAAGDSTKSDSAKADTSKAHAPVASRDSSRHPAPRAPAHAAFQVQVAAIGTAAGAEDAARKTRALGFSTVTVKDKGLYKVRAGGFATRAEAQAAAARIKARLGGSPFVVAGS